MEMFDPIYTTKILNDILSRRGLEVLLDLKEQAEPPPCPKTQDDDGQLGTGRNHPATSRGGRGNP